MAGCRGFVGAKRRDRRKILLECARRRRRRGFEAAVTQLIPALCFVRIECRRPVARAVAEQEVGAARVLECERSSRELFRWRLAYGAQQRAIVVRQKTVIERDVRVGRHGLLLLARKDRAHFFGESARAAQAFEMREIRDRHRARCATYRSVSGRSTVPAPANSSRARLSAECARRTSGRSARRVNTRSAIASASSSINGAGIAVRGRTRWTLFGRVGCPASGATIARQPRLAG